MASFMFCIKKCFRSKCGLNPSADSQLSSCRTDRRHDETIVDKEVDSLHGFYV